MKIQSRSKFVTHRLDVICSRNIYYIIGSDEYNSMQRLSLGYGHLSKNYYFTPQSVHLQVRFIQCTERATL